MASVYKKSIYLFLVISILLIPPCISISEAAPSRISEYDITARILNISGGKEYPDYRIKIIDGERTNGPNDDRVNTGKIITARRCSGRTCEVNDTIKARLTWQCDEFGEWYQLYEVKIADNDPIGTQTRIILYLGLIVVLFVAGFLLFIFTKKRRVRNKK